MNYRQWKRISLKVLVLAMIMRFGNITISEYYKLQKRRRALNKVLNRNHHKCHIYRKRFEEGHHWTCTLDWKVKAEHLLKEIEK